ncbi:hypothetical protein [Paenibacillus sp. LHD-38]|uniref:hypothetical protein n=1 Tax=Paenibacillus sp. LHD-38 TaxID=3072143 RepID=UPI00280E2BF3|nr:hypothetical protein [Paenibacillus sp. LHD-38]MDQ8737287.1 hypothetical protein [Paenibacillus sp. LHD-38]
MGKQNVRVAVVQAAPILFDKESAFQKIEKYSFEARQHGVKLLVKKDNVIFKS